MIKQHTFFHHHLVIQVCCAYKDILGPRHISSAVCEGLCTLLSCTMYRHFHLLIFKLSFTYTAGQTLWLVVESILHSTGFDLNRA